MVNSLTMKNVCLLLIAAHVFTGLAGCGDDASIADALVAAPSLSVTFTAPSDGAVYEAGQPVELTALISAPPGAVLTAEWASNLSGALETAALTEAGEITASLSLGPGQHTITLTVGSDSGAVASDSVTVEVRVALDAPAVTLKPAAPDTTADLTAEVSDAGPAELRFSWTVDGADAAITTATVSADQTEKGQTWQVTVVAVSGERESPPGAAQVTIANAVPSCTAASLTPAAPTTLDPVVCSCAERADADPDDEEKDTCAFVVAGEPVDTEGACTLSAGATQKNSGVVCTLKPSDGEGDGAPVTSAAAKVVDTPPVCAQPVLQPGAITRETTVECVLPEPAYDADGTSVQLSFEWLLNDSATPAGATVVPINQLTGPDAAPPTGGDVLACRVTPVSDGVSGLAVTSKPAVLDFAPGEVFGGLAVAVDGELAADGFEVGASATLTEGPFAGTEVTGTVAGDEPPFSWCLAATGVQRNFGPFALKDATVTVCLNGELAGTVSGTLVMGDSEAPATGSFDVATPWSIELAADSIGLAKQTITSVTVSMSEGDTKAALDATLNVGPLQLTATGALDDDLHGCLAVTGAGQHAGLQLAVDGGGTCLDANGWTIDLKGTTTTPWGGMAAFDAQLGLDIPAPGNGSVAWAAGVYSPPSGFEAAPGAVFTDGTANWSPTTGDLTYPSGAVFALDGTWELPPGFTLPDGSTVLPYGTELNDDGTFTLPSGSVFDPVTNTLGDPVAGQETPTAPVYAWRLALNFTKLAPPINVAPNQSIMTLLSLVAGVPDVGLRIPKVKLTAPGEPQVELTGRANLPANTLNLLVAHLWSPWQPTAAVLPVSVDRIAGDPTHLYAAADTPPPQIHGGLTLTGAQAQASYTAQTGWTTSASAPATAVLKSGAVTVEGALTVDETAAFIGTVTAFGGTAAVDETLPTSGGQVDDFSLSGPAEIAVPTATGGVPLEKGSLTYVWSSGQAASDVLASGELTALTNVLVFEGAVADDGSLTLESPPTAGEVGGFETDDLSATIDNAGVTLTAAVKAPAPFDGAVTGLWNSDADFKLVTPSQVDAWSAVLGADATLTIGPDGSVGAAVLSGELVSGTVSGLVTKDAFSLQGPASISAAGLQLTDGHAVWDSVAGISAHGQADIGFDAPLVTAELAKDAADWTFAGNVDTTLKAKAAQVTAQLQLDSGLGIQLLDVDLSALGGLAELPSVDLTADGPTVDPFQFGGPADIVVGPAAHPLDEGALSLHYNGDDADVTAGGTLKALGVELPVTGNVADDGSYVLNGPAQTGVVGGFPSDKVTALISSTDGIQLGADVGVPDVFDGTISGPWLSDQDFNLDGTSTGTWNPDLALNSTFDLSPDGAQLDVLVNNGIDGAEIAGSANGPVAYHGLDEGYDYHLKGPGSLAPAGLALESGELDLDSDIGFTAQGVADVGLDNAVVTALLEKGVAGYTFQGPMAALLEDDTVSIDGSVSIDNLAGLGLQDVTLEGLGAELTDLSVPIDVVDGEAQAYEVGGATDLKVGPEADHPLTGGELTVAHDPKEDGAPQVLASGKLDVGGLPTELMTAVLDGAGGYAFATTADLPIDTAKLGEGLAAISNLDPASFEGSFSEGGFSSGEWSAELVPTGDFTGFATANLGPELLQLAGQMTYSHCTAAGSTEFCEAPGTTFVGTLQFTLAGETILEFTTGAIDAEGALQVDASGIGDIPLDEYVLENGEWHFENDMVCFQGDLMGSPIGPKCLAKPGPWSVESDVVVIEVPGLPALQGIMTLDWDGEDITLSQKAITSFEGEAFGGDAVLGVDDEGNTSIVYFVAEKPAGGDVVIPGTCTQFGCLPDQSCDLDGKITLSIEQDVLDAKWCGTASCLPGGDKCVSVVDGLEVDICALYGITPKNGVCTIPLAP